MYSTRVMEIVAAVQRSANKGKQVTSQDTVHRQAAKEAGWGDGATAVLEITVEIVLDRLRAGKLLPQF